MALTLVINLTKVAQEVGIITADGKKTGIHLQPRGRAELEAGASVSGNWLALNPGCVRIHIPKEVNADVGTEPTVAEETVTNSTESEADTSAPEADDLDTK